MFLYRAYVFILLLFDYLLLDVLRTWLRCRLSLVLHATGRHSTSVSGKFSASC